MMLLGYLEAVWLVASLVGITSTIFRIKRRRATKSDGHGRSVLATW
jgi:hypothetical protein